MADIYDFGSGKKADDQGNNPEPNRDDTVKNRVLAALNEAEQLFGNEPKQQGGKPPTNFLLDEPPLSMGTLDNSRNPGMPTNSFTYTQEVDIGAVLREAGKKFPLEIYIDDSPQYLGLESFPPGGTDIGKALEKAYATIDKVQQEPKNLVIFTDGEPPRQESGTPQGTSFEEAMSTLRGNEKAGASTVLVTLNDEEAPAPQPKEAVMSNINKLRAGGQVITLDFSGAQDPQPTKPKM